MARDYQRVISLDVQFRDVPLFGRIISEAESAAAEARSALTSMITSPVALSLYSNDYISRCILFLVSLRTSADPVIACLSEQNRTTMATLKTLLDKYEKKYRGNNNICNIHHDQLHMVTSRRAAQYHIHQRRILCH